MIRGFQAASSMSSWVSGCFPAVLPISCWPWLTAVSPVETCAVCLLMATHFTSWGQGGVSWPLGFPTGQVGLLWQVVLSEHCLGVLLVCPVEEVCLGEKDMQGHSSGRVLGLGVFSGLNLFPGYVMIIPWGGKTIFWSLSFPRWEWENWGRRVTMWAFWAKGQPCSVSGHHEILMKCAEPQVALQWP